MSKTNHTWDKYSHDNVEVIVENGGGGRVSAAPVAEKIFNSYLERTKTNAD